MDHIEILHHRYASALFQAAVSSKKEGQIISNLEFMNNFIRDNKNAAKFLYNPQIEDEEKIKLLCDIAKAKDFCDEFVDFLRLLVKKRRLKIIHGIFLRYRDFYDEHKNRIVAFLKSAFELDESQIEKLKNVLSTRFKKEILIKQQIEPLLVGGITLKVEDRIYDASIKTKLLKLKEAITS